MQYILYAWVECWGKEVEKGKIFLTLLAKLKGNVI